MTDHKAKRAAQIECLRSAFSVIENAFNCVDEAIASETFERRGAWENASAHPTLPDDYQDHLRANTLLAPLWILRRELKDVKLDADDLEITDLIDYFDESLQSVNPPTPDPVFKDGEEWDILKLRADLKDRDRTISGHEANIYSQGKEIDRLKSEFNQLKADSVLSMKAIAINLEAIKGDRKPDETREVDGVVTKYRVYGEELTHRQKNERIDHVLAVVKAESKNISSRQCDRGFFIYDDDF